MKKILAVALCGLMLAGCQTTGTMPTSQELIAVIPPDNLYRCDRVPVPPIVNLTDLQVARYIVRLAEANEICADSMVAIKAYVQQAALRIEKGNPKKKTR